MTQHLSEEELAEFREIFNLVDRDGGGTITKEELGELMDTLGIDATAEEIDLMINEIDQDSNGEIDFEGSSPRARAACLVVTGTRTLSAALTFPIRPPRSRVCGCDVTKGQKLFSQALSPPTTGALLLPATPVCSKRTLCISCVGELRRHLLTSCQNVADVTYVGNRAELDNAHVVAAS